MSALPDQQQFAAAAGPVDWSTGRTAYEAARDEERHFDDTVSKLAWDGKLVATTPLDEAIIAYSDRLCDVRCAAEAALMAIPSPDAGAFAFKYLIAKGGKRETDCWDEMLEAEARRFSAPVAGTLRAKLAERNAMFVRDRDSDEDEGDLTRKTILLENEISVARPESIDDLIAQLVLAAQISAEGSAYNDAFAAQHVADATRMVGMGVLEAEDARG